MQVEAERAYPTPFANSTLLPLLLLSLAQQRHTPEPTCTFTNEYDYIIVGAGSAGSVVASRLSEYPCVRVLLLEAGCKPPLLTEVPSIGRYFYNTKLDWAYQTVPQRHTGEGFVNRQMPWVSGKMLGGSSSFNALVYVQGNMKNYDDWEDLGATGWSYNDVYPYFLKLGDNRDPEFLSNGYHSFGGPISVEQPKYHPPLKCAIREAAESLGYKILDSNAGKQTGFYDHQATLRNSQRCSTAKAYLVPAENRTNLDIVANAFVTKVLFEGNQATGVQFNFQGKTFRIKAKREVILSAGAINTPKILKLSGVGPREELQRFNIPVVADLAVGHNLQNHGAIGYPFTLGRLEPNVDEKLSNPFNIAEYISNRTGPLAGSDGCLFTACLKGLSPCSAVDFPNFQLFISEEPISLIRESGIKKEVFEQIYGEYEDHAIFFCTVQQVQPYSSGTVKLQSANPYIPPLIDPNYLSDCRDIDDIVDGLKICKRLLETEAFRRLGAAPLRSTVPGCEKFCGNDDEYFRCQARVLLFNFFHIAGTARMGCLSDPKSVVDPELKVKNVRNLRVVDASVMPLVPSANTNIPTIMVAEKASDIIKRTVKCFNRQDRQTGNPCPILIPDPPSGMCKEHAHEQSSVSETISTNIGISSSAGLFTG